MNVFDYWIIVENSVIELCDNFNWGSIKGNVVDVGGGSGYVVIIFVWVSFFFLKYDFFNVC